MTENWLSKVWPWGKKVMPYNRESNEDESIIWAGATNRYFVAVLQAGTSDDGPAEKFVFKANMRLLEGIDHNRLFLRA